MTLQEHKAEHDRLHQALDSLLADWITHTKCLPSKNTVLELMMWSNQQRSDPQETEQDKLGR